MSCSNCKTENRALIAKFDYECANHFWNVTVPQNIFNRIVVGENEMEILEKQRNFSIYFRLRGITDHAALLFTNKDKELNISFTVELRIAERPDVNRVELFTRKKELKENNGWIKIPVKVTSSQKLIYDKAINVLLGFGEYEGCHNCQDFVLAFCRATGMPKPFKNAREKLAFAGKVATVPFLAAGGVLLAAATVVTAPITAPFYYATRGKFQFNPNPDDWWMPMLYSCMSPYLLPRMMLTETDNGKILSTEDYWCRFSQLQNEGLIVKRDEDEDEVRS